MGALPRPRPDTGPPEPDPADAGEGRAFAIETNGLSPRELEIARLVACGYPDKTVAAVLDPSPWTVATYLRRIYMKSGVRCRAAMVRELCRRGLERRGPVCGKAGDARPSGVRMPSGERPVSAAFAFRFEPALLALGANLGDRAVTLDAAVRALDARCGRILARSPWIETEAVRLPDDPAPQPPYLNGVALLDCPLPPGELLAELLAIERSLGRDRSRETRRWQPRPIDLDLLALGERVLRGPDLVLPHPRLHERRFVLEPLVAVWPDWRHPVLGRTARELLADLDRGAESLRQRPPEA